MTRKSKDGQRLLRFVDSVLGSIFGGLILNIIWPTSLEFQDYLPTWLAYIPRPIIFVVLLIPVMWYVLPKRETWESLNTVDAMVVPRRPHSLFETVPLKQFGVNWRVDIGTNSVNLRNPHLIYYASGPFCPKCNYELDSKTAPKLFGYYKKEIWYCDNCNKEYERPKKQLFNEEKVIIKKIKSQSRNQNQV